MIKTIYKLAKIATELGGTTYEIAQCGGVLSAALFLENHIGNEKEKQKKYAKVVTEAYIHFQDREESDRVFLYMAGETSDKALFEAGKVENGRLNIAYDQLADLANKGCHCIYERSADGHNGRAFAYYNAAFGEKRTMLPFKMWDDDAYFMGNGHNRALFVTTALGDIFVMPDIQAVRESIWVVQAENLIREKYDAHFCVERMCWKEEEGNFPKEYAKLQQQIGYIKEEYPEVYESVWKSMALQRKEKKSPEGMCLSVGICMDYIRSFAVCLMPDGTISRIPNVARTGEESSEFKYYFEGYKEFFDEEISIESLEDIMRSVVRSAEENNKITVDKIYFTMVENAGWGTKVPDGKAFLNANLPEVEYVDYYTAIMHAYKKEDIVNRMEEGEMVLVYELDSIRQAWTLIQKSKNNGYEKICRVEEPYPEDGIYYVDEDFSHVYENTFQDIYEDEFGEPMVPGLREVMWSDMDHFMMEAGLRLFKIDMQKPGDKKAMEKMHSDWRRIKRQLLRNESVRITFQNIYMSMTEDYPIDRLEECFAPIQRNADVALEELLKESGVSLEQILTVVLAGESCEYPFVQKHLEEKIGKEVCIINLPECVAARGAVLQHYVNKQ